MMVCTCGLSCVHKTLAGAGDSQRTHEDILWCDEADLSPAQLMAGPAGTTIPVAFRIPRDAHQTERISSHDEFLWRLEALADVPGVNYHDIFEVPVFRTAQTPAENEPDGFALQFGGAAAPVRPAPMTVQVSRNTDGTEFYFPAARNVNMAVMTTVLMGIWHVVTYFTAHSHAPAIFPITFGFFGILLTYYVAQMWFATTRVTIGLSFKLQDGFLGGGKVREIAFSEIASIGEVIRTERSGSSLTPYYDIVLKRRDGRSVTLGRLLASKHETEWLVSEMRRLTGVQAKAASASS